MILSIHFLQIGLAKTSNTTKKRSHDVTDPCDPRRLIYKAYRPVTEIGNKTEKSKVTSDHLCRTRETGAV